MEEMASHGKGTYDPTVKKWKLRSKELTASASIRQLREIFRDKTIPASERESRPFWLRYLAELRRTQTIIQADAELEAAQLRYRDFDPDPTCSPFERGPDGKIRRKTPLSPDEFQIISLTQGMADESNPIEFRDYLREQLKAKLTPVIPKAESLKIEIEAAIERAKSRNTKSKGWFATRQFLEGMFLEITGDIAFRDITVQHYREYWKKVTESGWSQSTQANAMRTVNTFLKRLESDHDLRFGFRSNPDYKIVEGEGQKVQYTFEQLKTAISNASGVARTALLFGLNCGAYWGDITALKAEDIEGGYLKKGRAKNSKKTVQVVGCWYLWPETVEAIQYGLTTWQLEEAFRRFRQVHDLPEHKALRKTIAQMIQDEVGETEARLYRCEGVGGTHGRSYIRNFTPLQVEKLEAALRHVRGKLFD